MFLIGRLGLGEPENGKCKGLVLAKARDKRVNLARFWLHGSPIDRQTFFMSAQVRHPTVLIRCSKVSLTLISRHFFGQRTAAELCRAKTIIPDARYVVVGKTILRWIRFRTWRPTFRKDGSKRRNSCLGSRE